MLHERVKLRQGYFRKDLIEEINPSSAQNLTERLSPLTAKSKTEKVPKSEPLRGRSTFIHFLQQARKIPAKSDPKRSRNVDDSVQRLEFN